MTSVAGIILWFLTRLLLSVLLAGCILWIHGSPRLRGAPILNDGMNCRKSWRGGDEPFFREASDGMVSSSMVVGAVRAERERSTTSTGALNFALESSMRVWSSSR